MAMDGGGTDELGEEVFYAASHGDVNRLKELLRFKRFAKIKGALSWRDPFDRTPLMDAAAGGQTDMVRVLVEEYGVDIEESKFDAVKGEEFTPLVYAANVGHEETVQVLLKNGAKVDHAYPLHRACFAADNLGCVKLLVEHGADPNRRCFSGSRDGEVVDEGTPLSIACEQVCCKIVEYLLQKGANPNIADNKGNTPLHKAFEAIWNTHSERKCRGCCNKDGVKIVEMLIQHGASQMRNAMDLTPAMLAALTGKLSYFPKGMETLFGISPKETVEVLELMATHLIIQDGKHDAGVEMLGKAQGLKVSADKSQGSDGEKCPYGDYKEPWSYEELEEIKSDREYLMVVALMIRERILSPEAQKHHLWQAIRTFSTRCQRTEDGRMLALRALKHETNLEIESGFFCGFAVENLYRLLDPALVSLQDSGLEDVIILLKLAAINLSPDVSDMSVESRRDGIDYHRFKTRTFITLLSKYANYPALHDSDKELLMTIVQQLVMAFQVVTDVLCRIHGEDIVDDGVVAPERNSPMKAGHPISIFHMYYPDLASRRLRSDGDFEERLITMLLKCGADPSKLDYKGDNALHFLVKMCPDSSQNESFRKGVVMPLVGWGCPILQKNLKTGRTTIDDCKSLDTKQLLMDLLLPKLMDFAARVVRKNHISYSGLVPQTLASYLDMNV